ncbi:MAG: hypothetical protein Q4G50_11690 [Corynebacterium sp.]|uniref:DUF418 domain-containing protein n=1 Tax=Corynebacterium sp. TaxID=1720 RepID=UPI0026DF728C|nr:hypothetical protein [Corynebacterium sp.]MDO5670646.1 hypothetical protein [Corynebacterium sp.]
MSRIHGLDLARALAIIGMMAAHMGPEHFLSDGFPSVLFAVLAGVSMGIIASRTSSLIDARLRLITRAVILVAIGVVLAAVQSYIVIVLIAIGVSYILLLPALAWRTRWLVVLLGALVVLGPLVGALQTWLHPDWANEFFADLLYGSYPITAWLAYTLLGLLIHRVALAWDVVLFLLGTSAFLFLQGVIMLTGLRTPEEGFVGEWLFAEPHTGGLFDVLSSASFAAAVIGACLLACRVGAIVWATYPLRSIGAMSLTVYIVHVIATTIANGTFVSPTAFEDVAAVPSAPPGFPTAVPVEDPLWPTLFVAQLIGFLVFASLWRWRFRRGPAEWVVARIIVGAVSEPAPAALKSLPR